MIKTLTNKISSMDSRQRKSIEKFMTIAAFCTVMVFFPQLAFAEESAAASGAEVVTSNFNIFIHAGSSAMPGASRAQAEAKSPRQSRGFQRSKGNSPAMARR